ncbi:probable elongator complex protein 5 [Coccomyxa sp. Obi]|nr:probable elongator complex protein 5 [Coccomyxa sp. Obi]
MDELLRCLRDGAIGSKPPPLVLLQDSLPTIGGPNVVSKVAADFCTAVKQRRAQAKEVLDISLRGSGTTHTNACRHILGAELSVLRLQGDSERTLEELAEAVSGCRPSTSAVASAEISKDDVCSSNRASVSSAAAGQPCLAVIVDSLSTLLFMHPEQQVLEFVDKLQRTPSISCIFATLHSDLHEMRTVQALERAAACVAQLIPVAAEPGGTHVADTCLEVRLKQHTGRVKVVRRWYQLLVDGSLLEVDPDSAATSAAAKAPFSTVPAASLPGSASGEEARKEAAALAVLSEKMGGGMRLTLTEHEAAARQNVVLPWEQRQNGAQSQDDFKKEAATGLGQIIYERDSETDPDSDEDPDDDLDF